MKKICLTILCLSLLGIPAIKTFSHCEIPCGIYDDKTRLTLINEHITTIEKSIKQIIELQKD